jgi:integrase
MGTNPKPVLRNVVSHGKRVGRRKNAEVRTREHLTPGEVELLARAARARGRYGSRDALAIRMAARHGFRVSELCELRWDQIDLRAGLIRSD